MPTLSVTKSYSDGSVLTEADLDAMKNSLETFFNTTKIDADNIQDSGVTTAKIAASAVTTAKIADANVTTAKLAAGVGIPIGAIMPYAATSAPTGWLLCDGSAVSRTTYADLFAIISTTHGQGNGSTTFNVPDYRGRFLRGVDGVAGRDPDAASRTTMATGGNSGNNVGSVQSGAYASHTHIQDAHNHTQDAHTHTQNSHTHTDSGHTHAVNGMLNGTAGTESRFLQSTSGGTGSLNTISESGTANISSTTATNQNTTATNQATTATNQSSGGNETRPINAYVTYIIKT
jgi:microcystin-dependent protein